MDLKSMLIKWTKTPQKRK